MNKKKMRRGLILIYFFLFAVLFGSNFLFGCGKSNEQAAYEEVIATMSMQKAKLFFDRYPGGIYREKLVNFIIEWANKEQTEESYKLALYALPRDHPKYKITVEYFERNFGPLKYEYSN